MNLPPSESSVRIYVVKGADDAGGTGWMLWNPRNDYTAAALRPKDAQQ